MLGMILIISDVVYYAGIFILYKLICEDDFNYLVLISFIFLLVGLLGASVSNFLKDKEYISLHSKCVEVNVIIKQLLIGISFIGAQIDSVVFKYALIGFSMIGIIVTIRLCITKISTFLILCDLAVCLATLYVSFSLVFALMRYLQGKVFLIRFYSPTTLSSSRAEFRLPSRLACA